MNKCLVCGKKYSNFNALIQHMERSHADTIPKDYTAAQYNYFLKTGKEFGNCIICRGKTMWNDETNKYKRFCNDPRCKEKYKDEFKKRMIGKYGKVSLLNDPEHQKKMLANRSISGKYTWSDGGIVPYTGSYELDFLRFLDNGLNYSSDDIMAPSPHTYYYIFDGLEKFYIPDFFIPSLNLEIEIKDGGDNPNNHHKIQNVDKKKEELKDNVLMSQREFSYIKITNKRYDNFFEFLKRKKEEFEKYRTTDKAIFIIDEPKTPMKKAFESYDLKEEQEIVIENTMNSLKAKGNKLLEPVFVLLTHSGSLLASAIKYVTKDPYSHSSISFDSNLKNMYSFGRKYKDNPLSGTFVKEDIKSGFYESVADTATYSLYVTFVTPEEKKKMYERLEEFKNSPMKFKYNFIGLIKYKFGIEDRREDSYFCSQFVSTILSAGKDFFDRDHSLIKPYDFAKHREFFFVTKGLLKNYNPKKVDALIEKLKK